MRPVDPSLQLQRLYEQKLKAQFQEQIETTVRILVSDFQFKETDIDAFLDAYRSEIEKNRSFYN